MKSSRFPTTNISPGSDTSKPVPIPVLIREGLVIDELWAWGPEPPAALVSVAFRLVLGNETADTRFFRMALRPQVAAGAVMDRLTYAWWEDRRREKHYLWSQHQGGEKSTVRDMAEALNGLYAHLPVGSPVWFTNASVAAPLLRSAFYRAGVVPGWGLNDQLCLTTVRRAIA